MSDFKPGDKVKITGHDDLRVIECVGLVSRVLPKRVKTQTIVLVVVEGIGEVYCYPQEIEHV